MNHLETTRAKRAEAFRSLDVSKADMLAALEVFRRDANTDHAATLADHAAKIAAAAADVARLDRSIRKIEAILIEEGEMQAPQPIKPRYPYRMDKARAPHYGYKVPEGARGGSVRRVRDAVPAFALRIARVTFERCEDRQGRPMTKMWMTTLRGRVPQGPARWITPRLADGACHAPAQPRPVPKRRTSPTSPPQTLRDRADRLALTLAAADANRRADRQPTAARRVLAWIDTLDQITA